MIVKVDELQLIDVVMLRTIPKRILWQIHISSRWELACCPELQYRLPEIPRTSLCMERMPFA